MNEDAGTKKIRQEDLDTPQQEEAGDMTGEEIEKLANLFAESLEHDQDTGSFDPVSADEDTGPFKPVND